jgi:phospholipid/cholesterol/gamma-HCH transport system substrate-binding protein
MTRGSIIRYAVAALVLALLASAVGLQLIPREHGHAALFSHASGIKPDDEVRVAGIPSGTVTDVELDGADARVLFDLDDDVVLRTDARAAVKMATLLGKNYLEVDPGTGARAADDAEIPVDRTTPAYTLSDVLTRTKQDLGDLDLDAVDEAIGSMATALDQDPAETDAALRGTTKLARLIGEKDEQLGRLLTHVHEVTSSVRAQQDELESLLEDADVVATLVVRRRQTIERLLTNAQSVVRSMEELARENSDEVSEVLDQMHVVLSTLRKNADDLDASLERLAPMARYFSNATGNGPWIDVFAPFFLLPDNVVCVLDIGRCS